MLEKIIASCPKELDLTDDSHSEIIIETVEKIAREKYSVSEIEEIEDELIAQNDDALIFVLLALKIAKSKIIASKTKEPLMVSIFFAIYKEHNRIKKISEHPHGEDFLLKKVAQLEWLFKDSRKIEWELIIVDDGCPEGSGHIAQSIVDKNDLSDKVRVLFLDEAIEHKLPPANTINSTDESQKGGSIVYGMWDAIKDKTGKDQIVVYTDADLSTHLGQLMLLVDPLISRNKLAAIGSRRETRSVVIKKGARNDRGKLFIYLWKRLIPNLGEIIDTQCGFKAFRAEIVPEIIEGLLENKFAFDIELLLRTELLRDESIIKVPIAWIDSEAASTTTDLQPYLPMLKAIVKMNRKYFPNGQQSDEFADLINSWTVSDFNKILENIPQQIVRREPMEFTDYNKIRAVDFN